MRVSLLRLHQRDQLAEPARLRLALQATLLVEAAVRSTLEQRLGLAHRAGHRCGQGATRSATVASSSSTGTAVSASPMSTASLAPTIRAVAQISSALA